MQMNHTLNSLNLGNNNLGPEGCAVMGDVLKVSRYERIA